MGIDLETLDYASVEDAPLLHSCEQLFRHTSFSQRTGEEICGSYRILNR